MKQVIVGLRGVTFDISERMQPRKQRIIWRQLSSLRMTRF